MKYADQGLQMENPKRVAKGSIWAESVRDCLKLVWAPPYTRRLIIAEQDYVSDWEKRENSKISECFESIKYGVW